MVAAFMDSKMKHGPANNRRDKKVDDYSFGSSAGISAVANGGQVRVPPSVLDWVVWYSTACALLGAVMSIAVTASHPVCGGPAERAGSGVSAGRRRGHDRLTWLAWRLRFLSCPPLFVCLWCRGSQHYGAVEVGTPTTPSDVQMYSLQTPLDPQLRKRKAAPIARSKYVDAGPPSRTQHRAPCPPVASCHCVVTVDEHECDSSVAVCCCDGVTLSAHRAIRFVCVRTRLSRTVCGTVP